MPPHTVRERATKRHADPVRRRDLNVPWQTRVVQIQVRDRREVAAYDSGASGGLHAGPRATQFPESRIMDAIVQSPRSRVSCRSRRYQKGI
jgi:hypothetical protein